MVHLQVQQARNGLVALFLKDTQALGETYRRLNFPWKPRMAIEHYLERLLHEF